MKIAVFDAKEYDRNSFEKYTGKRNIECTYFDVRLTIDTVKLASGFDGVCIFVNDIISKEVIDALYSFHIQAIFLRCAGFNNIDLNAIFGKIHVFRVPAYSPHAIAEHAFALLQTSNRRIHKAYNRVREYNFSLNDLTGMDLYGKTVGVIGTGKIGKCFIQIALGYGMNVLAYDMFPSSIPGVQYVDLETLYRESDVISLHCPLSDDNFHMINSDSIQVMKKGVILINTSRGGLIDSLALLDGIKSRKIGAACLDVYEEESDIFFNDKSNHILNDDLLLQLIAMPNVIITSHQAFLTREALDNIADTTTQNILDFFNHVSNDNEICYHCSNMANCKKKRNIRCF